MSYTATPRKYQDSKIEAVVTCWNYGDFLAETLPFTISQVDRLVVVTDHNDALTRALCDKWSVECVPTDAFTEKGDAFCKGAGINLGLAALRQQGWIIHLDADIVLPSTFRNMVDKSGLQRSCIYGAERVNVCGYERWHQLRQSFHTDPQFSYRYIVATPPDLPIGAHVIHKQHGYVPIGYFQMWHSQHMHQNNFRYPEVEGTAENMDVQFALRWPRKQRILLPTVRVFHLESEAAPMGVNWNGRKTKPFTQSGGPLTCEPSKGYGYGGYGYAS